MLQESRATSLKRLSILDFGLFQVQRISGIPGYFIQSSEGNILVDSGFPRHYALYQLYTRVTHKE